MVGCVLLIVVIAQLSIVYQKRSVALQIRQEPLRRRIQSLRDKACNNAQDVQLNSGKALKEIEFSVDSLSHFDQVIGKAINQLEVDVQTMFPDNEEDNADHSARLLVQGFDPRVVLEKVLRRREGVESHITMLRNDAVNIRRNMQRLQTMLARTDQKGEES